jgi:hypothetical protein
MGFCSGLLMPGAGTGRGETFGADLGFAAGDVLALGVLALGAAEGVGGTALATGGVAALADTTAAGTGEAKAPLDTVRSARGG